MKKYIPALALLILWAGNSSAAMIVQYTFPGSAFAPTTVAPNTSSTDVNDTGSSADLEPGAALPNSAFLEQLILSTTPAAAVANNQFFQFTTTPNAGFELDLTSLTFDAGRGGASTPRGFVLRSSLDGFSTDIATATIPTVQPTLTNFSIDLTGAAFQNINTAVTFRIYGFAPAANGVGNFYDNLTLNGEVVTEAVVPEPSSVTMAITAAVFGFGLARRRKRTAG
jgi:hypothetical protein